jgi:hypothetical protein
MSQVQTFTIDNWHPTSINELTKGRVRRGIRLKKLDRNLVAAYAIKFGITKATGRRRVDLTIVLGPRQRGCDPDAYHKSLLDALKNAGLLIQDTRHGVSFTEPTYIRADAHATIITLTDLPTPAATPKKRKATHVG